MGWTPIEQANSDKPHHQNLNSNKNICNNIERLPIPHYLLSNPKSVRLDMMRKMGFAVSLLTKNIYLYDFQNACIILGIQARLKGAIQRQKGTVLT